MAFPYDAAQSSLGAVRRVKAVLETHLAAELTRRAAMHGLTLPEPVAVVTGAPTAKQLEGNRIPLLMVEGAEVGNDSRDGTELLRSKQNVHVYVVLSAKAIEDDDPGELHDALLAYAEAVGLTVYQHAPDRRTFVKCEPFTVSQQRVSRDSPTGRRLGQSVGARRVTIRVHTETPERPA